RHLAVFCSISQSLNFLPLISGDAELANSSISLIGVHLPTFWNSHPAVWFRLAEVQFQTRRVTDSYTMFPHVVSELPVEIVQEASNVIMNPHPSEPYEHLKSILLKRIIESEQSGLEQLISGLELDDRKPSQLLRRLLPILDGRCVPSSTKTLSKA
ncbi:uncharacterized protein DEA37_0012811, partial [Paragonimus westermani]